MVLPRRHGKPRSETQQQVTAQWRRALPTYPDGAWIMDSAPESPEGQSARAGAQQGGKTQQIHKAAPPNQMPRSETQQQEPRIDHGALPRFDGTRPEQRIKHSTAPNASKSHAPKAPSSARHPDATKRDLSRCQNALTKRRCPPRRRFSSVTRRKAPAANSPRNNAARCRQPDAITRKQIKTNSPKYGSA